MHFFRKKKPLTEPRWLDKYRDFVLAALIKLQLEKEEKRFERHPS